MSQEQKSFWSTIPGILTGCGAVIGAITAIGGCLLALVQAGFLKPPFPTPAPSITSPPPGNNNPDISLPSSTSVIPDIALSATFEIPFPPISTETPSLTPTPFYAGPPLIAFVSNSSGRGVVYTMQVDGRDQHAITSFEYDSDTPSWSPNGQWIYFSANRDGNYDIYRMRWDGRDVTKLTTDARDELWPRLSPNGSKIVYGVKFGEDNFQLFVMNPDGSGVQNISNSLMNEERPSWFPDSLRVMLMYCRGPASPIDLRCEIYSMKADGTEKHNITVSSWSEIWPSISPDGTTIAFVANIRSYDDTAASNIDIFLANSNDGTNIRRVTSSPSVDTNPSWSPDGSRILFKYAKDDTSETDIWVISANGTGLSQLTFLPGNETYPAWQP